VILFFYVRPDGLLSRTDGIGKRLLANQEIARYVTDYRGNRITVNGIAMTVKKLGKVLGTLDEPFVSAIDVEVPGDVDISYDVARNKVVGAGINIVKRELRSAVLKGLRSQGITERCDQHTLLVLCKSPHSIRMDTSLKVPGLPAGDRPVPGIPIVAPEVLAAVREQLPSPPWPVGMHHMIADTLGITPNLVFRAIGALIASGQVSKGYSSHLDRDASNEDQSTES